MRSGKLGTYVDGTAFIRSPSTKPVICLGCAFWDSIFRVEAIPSNGKVIASKLVQAASGMITVAAVALTRMGGRAILWTRIGDDYVGDLFLADLASEGVPIEGVRRIRNGRTWVATILVDAAGERLVVPFVDPSLDASPEWLPLDQVRDAGAVMVDTRWPEGAEALLASARQAGVPTILDADVAPVETLRCLVPLSDHVVFSEPALALMEPGPSDRALLAVASAYPSAIVGVTLGARGALIRDWTDPPGHVRTVPSITVAAVDTLNAGDVWHAAYALGLVNGWTTEARVQFANVAAAIKCETFGGRAGAPSFPTILARLAAEAGGNPP